jgi:Ice-binding-like
MSNPARFRGAWRTTLALAFCFAFVAVPAASAQTPVDLATASPFVVLGGQTVTNTGPSVLNGDLGVSPGAALVGFGLPATVNGATHANDAVAAQAQSDLTTAYNVAAGQPQTADLSGTDLGNRTLTAGAYRYTAGAQLTGALTLNAQGDPNAQFVFMIGSALTTASASSVLLINGASPCNVYWQVGSSATLGSTTAFQGNLMALTSISLNNGATVLGRMLARNGQVSLINNVLDSSMCTTGSTPPGSTPPGSTPPGSTPPGTGATPPGGSAGSGGQPGANAGRQPVRPNRRRALRAPGVTRRGTATVRRSPRAACTAGFSARVRGHLIQRVVFRLDGRRISSRTNSPYRVFVRAAPGRHLVTARVSFTDATRARTMRLRYRACAAALVQPPTGPSPFTG